MTTKAFREGVAARRSADREPKSGYMPGTEAYAEFARGFQFDPLPDISHMLRPQRVERKKPAAAAALKQAAK